MDKKELYSTLEELRTGLITSDMAMEQILLLFSVSGQSELLLSVAKYVYNHFDDSSSKTANDYLQEFLSQ